MERYEKNKPSGVEWIGKIPKHWEAKRLKFNTYIKARVGWHGLKADEFSLADGVFCVTGTDLQNGEINWENCYRVSEERYEEDPYIQLRENDLLITKDGTIGKVAVVKNLNERATLNSGVFVVRPERKEYVTPFMYWALQSPVFFEYVNYTSKGSTINHLYQETFFNLPFILPLPEEQTAIANYLDEKTAQIDTLIANKQKLIDLLKEERTAIINHAVTKGINPKAKCKPSGIEWLGDIPAHWEVKKLKYYIDILTDYTANGSFAGLAENVQYYTTPNFSRLVRLTDLREHLTNDGMYVDEHAHHFLKKSSLYGGEILLANVGAYAGLVCKMPAINYPATLGPNMFLLKFEKDLDNDYAYFLLAADIVESQLKLVSISTAQPKLNKDNVKDVLVVVPPLEEQKDILNFIETKTEKVDTILLKTNKEIELLQEYRMALISEVVTGKVKVA